MAWYDETPTANSVTGAAAGGVITSSLGAGAAPGVVGGAIVGADGLVKGAKSVGGMIGDMNPLNHKLTPGQIPGVDATGIGGITGPAAPTGGPAQIRLPGTFTGGQIATPGAPTAAQIAVMGGDQNAFRQAQLNAINGLSGIANGSQPSIAGQAATNMAQQNIAAQYALANSQRGGANPAAARQAMQNAATMNTDMVQQAAQAQSAERLQAAGLLAQTGAAGYGQDIDVAKSQAGLTQQATLAGYQGGLQSAISQGSLDQDTAKTIYTTAAQAGLSQGQLDQAWNDLQAKYAQMGLDASKANSAAALDLQKLIQSGAIAQTANSLAVQQGNNQIRGNVLGGLGSMFGGAASMFGGGGAGGASGGTAAAGSGGMAGAGDGLAEFAAMA